MRNKSCHKKRRFHVYLQNAKDKKKTKCKNRNIAPENKNFTLN